MTTKTEAAKPHAIRLGPDRSDLIPAGCKAVPKLVAEANEAALAAIEEREAANAEHAIATEAVRVAPDVDRAADRAASAAGEDLPERSEPQRRAVLDKATRRSEAAQGVAKQRMRELSEAVASTWPEWIEDQRAAVAETRAEIAKQIDSLRVTFRRHQIESELLRGLLAFAGEGNFNGFGRPHADRAEARATAKAEAVEQKAIELGGNRPVPRDLPSLLAALTLLAENEIAGR